MDPVVFPAIVAGASAVAAGVLTQATQWWLDRSRRHGDRLEATNARIYESRREAHLRMARKGQEILAMMTDPVREGREVTGQPAPDWSWIAAQVTPLQVDLMIFAGPEASAAAKAFSEALIVTGEGGNGDPDDAQAAYARYLEAVRADLGVSTLTAKGIWPQPTEWKRHNP